MDGRKLPSIDAEKLQELLEKEFEQCIAQLRKEVRSPNKRKALRELLNYIAKRASQCDYPGFREKGWQIGSGPTEAMCKVLTCRLKGAGMRWDRQGAEETLLEPPKRGSITMPENSAPPPGGK